MLGDEGGGLKLFAEVAQFLRRNRNASPSKAPWSAKTVKQFAAAASKLAKKLDQLDFTEQQTEAACQAFTDLTKVLGELPLETTEPTNRALVEAINIPQHKACFTGGGNRRQLRTKTKWQEAATLVGRSKADGQKAHEGTNELSSPVTILSRHSCRQSQRKSFVKSHPTPTPSLACKNDPFDGAETGGAEPQIAEREPVLAGGDW